MELSNPTIGSEHGCVKTNPDSKPELRIYRAGDTVKTNGTAYEILLREGNLAYAVYREHHGSKRWNLELWLIRGLPSDKKLPDGSVQPKGTEYLPSASLWGTYAVSLAPWWDAKPEIASWEDAKSLMHPGYPEKIKRFNDARFANPAFPARADHPERPSPTGQSRPAAPKRPIK